MIYQENWNGTCKNGRRQSPINIRTEYTKKIRMAGNSLIFNRYDKQVGASLENNGHTIKLTFTDGTDDEIWIKDGGLSLTKFQFAQAHFHWGNNDNQGSEHEIDGVSFPMEMHIVHWNLDVGETLKEAVDKDTGISLEVLGVHFKIGKTNEKFKYFFDAVKRTTKHNETAEIRNGIRLYDLLPENKDAFYRYKGSLTTPGCNEIVMWTVFKEKIEIDKSQMEIIRQVKYTHDGSENLLSNNFRNVKLQYDREILDVDVHEEATGIIIVILVIRMYLCVYSAFHYFLCTYIISIPGKDKTNGALIGVIVACLMSVFLVVAYCAAYYRSKNKFNNRNKPRADFMSPS